MDITDQIELAGAHIQILGKDGNVEFAGHAMITDCLGNVLEEAKSSQESYVIAELTRITNKEERQGFGTQIKEKSVLI